MIGQANGHTVRDVRSPERPVGDMFQELARDTSRLVSLELELAKTELTEKISATGKDAGMVAAGGLIAYAGLLAIIAGVILALSLLIPTWLSALIVGIVVALIGYGVLQKALNSMKKRSLAPKQTIESLKQDQQWLKEQV